MKTWNRAVSVAALALLLALTVSTRQAPVAAAPETASAEQQFLSTYCYTCHNDRLKTGGLTLQSADITNVGAHPDVWEKVVRKLRMRAMPPPAARRPDVPAYDAMVSYLETSLDRVAAVNPNPGRTEALHRLNRIEYRNAIRDLLALDIDVSKTLPADGIGGGFDNVAGVLNMSPALMERYLTTARAVSRLAVGLPTTASTTDTYTLPNDLYQTDRMNEELPFGSRGGLAVRHQFPVDGEYNIKVRLAKNYVDFVSGGAWPHELQLALEGTVIQKWTVGGDAPGSAPPVSYEGNIAGTPDWEDWAHHTDERLNVKVAVKAGPRAIAAMFPREMWEPDGIVHPRQYGASLGQDARQDDNPAVAEIIVEGPLSVSGGGDTPSRRRIFVCQPKSDRDAEGCAKRVVTSLARRAFRRPVTDADVTPLLAFYTSARKNGSSFEEGVQFALERVLSDPEFVFRVERDPASVKPGQSYRVSDLELASRLSFFLWSSIPDDELLAVAEQGKLKDPARLEQQVRRMLADPKSKSLVESFAGQWLYLRNIEGWIPEPGLYPEFDDNLRQALRSETELFFEDQVRNDRSILELLSANYSFLNERLARHYGVPGVYGSQFRRVTFPDTRTRGGLLGQASILMVTSYPTRTSPVLRGKYLLSNVLGVPPPPPPPDVMATLPDKGEGGKPATVRERLEMHRKNAVCASCHSQMDPLGFALENYDVVGAWHETSETNKPVDAVGALPDGTKFEGMQGLRNVLLTKYPKQFVETVTERLMTYGLGRELEYYDQPVLRQIAREAAAHQNAWSSVIFGIVNSRQFQMRRSAS